MMTAEQLGISTDGYEALVKVLAKMEAGEIKHIDTEKPVFDTFTGMRFNMNYVHMINYKGCGTVCCILGWAKHLSRNGVFPDITDGVNELFYPTHPIPYNEITVEQAIRALRNYLTTGEAKWEEVLS